MFARNRTFNPETYAAHLHRRQCIKRAAAKHPQSRQDPSAQRRAHSNEETSDLDGNTQVAPSQATYLPACTRNSQDGTSTALTEAPTSTSSLGASRSQGMRSGHIASRSGMGFARNEYSETVHYCLYCYEELPTTRFECRTCSFTPRLCKACCLFHPPEHKIVLCGGPVEEHEKSSIGNCHSDTRVNAGRSHDSRHYIRCDGGEPEAQNEGDCGYDEIGEKLVEDVSNGDVWNENEDTPGFATNKFTKVLATLSDDEGDDDRLTDSNFDDDLTENERDALEDALQEARGELGYRRQRSTTTDSSEPDLGTDSSVFEEDVEESSPGGGHVDDEHSGDEMEIGITDDTVHEENERSEDRHSSVDNAMLSLQRDPNNQGNRSLPTRVTVTFSIDAFLNLRNFINDAASSTGLLQPNTNVSTGQIGSAVHNELLDFDCDELNPRANEEILAPSRTSLKQPRSKRLPHKRSWLAADKTKLREYKAMGWKDSRIGIALRRTPNAVKKQWRKQDSEKRAGM